MMGASATVLTTWVPDGNMKTVGLQIKHQVTLLRKAEAPLKHLKVGQTDLSSEQNKDTNLKYQSIINL